MWEAGFSQGQNHALVSNLLVFFLRGALISLAQVELFNEELSPILF